MASSTRASKLIASEKLAALGATNLTTALELFAASNALQQSASLRSVLSDPSAEVAGKEQVVRSVFGAKFSQQTVGLLIELSKLRWSATRDLPAAIEQLGVRVAAQTANIDQLQAELFAIEQTASSDPELELALSSNRDVDAKHTLIRKLFAGKVSDAALSLAVQAIDSAAYKRFAQVVGQYGVWVAEYAGEFVARVRVAKELSQAQLQRLEAALNGVYGKKLQLNVEVDPEVLGGIHVAVAGEVIDATVLTKISNARLQLS
ncbi:MAG: F0F1 ATP synthase subunit delta [Actinobacteria bacterium]|nr:F0F1 ATP synthase subunit delta [Actinomycetota bacterium]